MSDVCLPIESAYIPKSCFCSYFPIADSNQEKRVLGRPSISSPPTYDSIDSSIPLVHNMG